MFCFKLVVERGTIVGYRTNVMGEMVDISYDFLDRSQAGKEVLSYLNSVSTPSLVYSKDGTFGTKEEHESELYVRCIDSDKSALSSLLSCVSVCIKNKELLKVSRGKFVDRVYSYEFLVDKVVRAEVNIKIDNIAPSKGTGWDVVMRVDTLSDAFVIYAVSEEDRECSFSDELEGVKYKLLVGLHGGNLVRKFNLFAWSQHRNTALVIHNLEIGLLDTKTFREFRGICKVENLSERLECMLHSASGYVFVTSRKFYFNDTRPEYYSVNVYSSDGRTSKALLRNARATDINEVRQLTSGDLQYVIKDIITGDSEIYYGEEILNKLA